MTDARAASVDLEILASGPSDARAAAVALAVLARSTGPDYDLAVLADAPAFYLKLDETSGTVATDYSGKGNHFTYQTGVSLAQPGLLSRGGGTSVAGNGSNAIAILSSVAGFTANSAFTLEAWIYLSSASQQLNIISIGNGSNGYSMDVNNTGYSTNGNHLNAAAAGIYAVQSGVNIGTGIHHVAFTRNGNATAFYIDGVQVAANGSGWSSTNAPTTQITIGGPSNIIPSSDRVDSVAAYATALSSARILAHYQAGVIAYDRAVQSLNPRLFWKLDETSGTSFTSSGTVTTALTASGSFTPNQGSIYPDGNSVVTNNAYGYAASSLNSEIQSWTQMTACAWVIPGSSAEPWVVGTEIGSSTFSFFLGMGGLLGASYDGGHFHAQVGNGNQVTSTTAPVAGKPYFLMMTVSNTGVVKLYVNGLLEATSGTGTTNFSSWGGNNVWVGRRWDTSDYLSNHLNTSDTKIGGVALFNTVLTDADAKTLYGAAFPLPNTVAAVANVPMAFNTPYPSQVIADAPLFYARLNEPSGTTLVDWSGNGRNGSYLGSPTLGATGLVVGDPDTAVTFASGKYANITYGSWMNVTNVTVEALIKLTSYPGGGARATIFSHDDETGNRAFSFEVEGTNHLEGLFFISGSPYFVTGTTVLELNRTYHVAFRFDGSYAKVYLNGVEDGSTTRSGSLQGANIDARIGCSPYTNRFPFIGTLDEIALYGSAISPTRILDHAVASGVTSAYITAPVVAATAAVTTERPAIAAPRGVGSTPAKVYNWEDGTQQNWTYQSSQWNTAPVNVEGVAHSGVRSIRFTRTGSSQGMGYCTGDTFAVTANTKYRVQAWIKANNSGGYRFIALESGWTGLGSQDITAVTGQWVKFEFDFNSGAYTSVFLILNDDPNLSPSAGNQVHLDDVTVIPYDGASVPAFTWIPTPDINVILPAPIAAVAATPFAMAASPIELPPVQADTSIAVYDFENDNLCGFTTHGASWDAPATTAETAPTWWESYRVLKLVRNTATPGGGHSLNDNVITLLPHTNYRLWWNTTGNLAGWHHRMEVLDGVTTLGVAPIYNDGSSANWSNQYIDFNSGTSTSAQVRISDDNEATPVAGTTLYVDNINLVPMNGAQAHARTIVWDGKYGDIQVTADNAEIRGDFTFYAPSAWTIIPTPDIPILITPDTIAAIASVPHADDGAPPNPVTDATISTVDFYSIRLGWTNPTDYDFDHVLILRNDGLPWPEPGDELLDSSIVKIETTGASAGNATALTAYPVASGNFHDVQDTTGRPNDGYRWTPASWYRYTPVADGTLTIDTIGNPIADWDTYLTIYDFLPAADGSDTPLALSDDDGGDHGGTWGTSWIELTVTAGTTYWICAQGYSSSGANYVGNMYFNLVGPASSETPPAVSGPSYTDTGLLSGTTYYYSLYAVDTIGITSLLGAQMSATTPTIAAPEPMTVTVAMPAGSILLAPGTPTVPEVGFDLDYYGYPLTATVTMPMGTVWVENLLNPPPVRPGSQIGFPAELVPWGTRTDTDIRVEVWDYTNTTKLGDLEYSAARQFLDEYNGVGSGTLQVPAIMPEAANLKRDRVLRFYYKDIPDAVFASVIEGRKTTVVAEAGSHWAVVNGRGILSWLEDAVVLPYVDPSDLLPNSGWRVMADGSRYAIQSNLMEDAPDVRAFNFGSRDAPNHNLFDDLGPGSGGSAPALNAYWAVPVGIRQNARTDIVKGYPKTEVKIDQYVGLTPTARPRLYWPDPLAQWIWSGTIQQDKPDGQERWFRGFFSVGVDTSVRISGTADNYGTFYLDGVPLFSTNTWQKYWSVGVTLKAGNHVLAIHGTNANTPAVKYNPAGVMVTVEGPVGIIFRSAANNAWEVTSTPQTFSTTEANHGPGWHRPLGIAQGSMSAENKKKYFPTDWPDPAAKWIWGSDPTMTSEAEQICYFRNKVRIDQAGTYRWFITADDGYVCWVDGIEVLSLDYEGSAANGWMRYDSVDLDLSAGIHVFAIRGRNQTNASQFTARGNPAAVIGTLMMLDGNLKPSTPVPWTATNTVGPTSAADQGWFANWSGPAWKAGDVLYTLINEAKGPNRAVTRLTNVTMDFTPEKDSNGNDWTTRVSRTWDIGTSLLQVAFDLCELGVDIWMTPDNVLHCAERRGKSDPTFSIEYGVNISGYDVDETFSGASVAYTRTRAGWFTLENDTSNLILGGRRETGISLANTDSEDIMIGISHRAIGAVVMANMVATAQAIIPRYADPTANPPVQGSIPYVDVNISDIIYVLNPAGGHRMGRLLSISVSENEAGATTWVPEIEIWSSPFGDGVDPARPHDPPDPNSPYDPSTWVPAAEDWTRFIPAGAGSDYPRAVTIPQADAWVSGGTAASRAGAVTMSSPGVTGGSSSPAEGNLAPLSVPSPSPSGATPVPLNSAEHPRPAANALNNALTPEGERIAVSKTPPLLTAGYHLWVDTSGLV